MNKVLKLFLAVALAASPVALMAQNDRPEPPQRGEGAPEQWAERPQMPKMTSEQIAHQMTDRMDRMLTLTDSQYQKIYKLNLKEVKEMEADSLFLSRRGGFGGPMGPGFGPRPGGPGMGPRPGGPGFGPGMGPGNEGGRMSEEQLEQLRAEREKARVKKDKKLRKILTDEQYGIWIKAEQERLIRMRERQRDGMGGGRHRHMGPRPEGAPGPRPDSAMAPPMEGAPVPPPQAAPVPQAEDKPAE